MFERLKRTPHKRYVLKNHQFDNTGDLPTKMSKILPKVDGNYVSLFPLTENLGQHSINETSIERTFPKYQPCIDGVLRNSLCPMLRCRDEANPLLVYPIGVRLYFKMMKAVYRAFFWLSIISFISMYIMWFSSGWDNDVKNKLVFGVSTTHQEGGSTQEEQVSFIDKLYYGLFFISLGSIGERKYECRSVELNSKSDTHYYGQADSDLFSLTCASGYINSIHAFYGQPYGTCQCPVKQQLNDQGQCQANLKFGSSYDGDDDTNRGTCNVNGGGCIKAETLFGESCCAHRLMRDEQEKGRILIPDLTDILPRDNPTCYSDTAQYIIQVDMTHSTSLSIN